MTRARRPGPLRTLTVIAAAVAGCLVSGCGGGSNAMHPAANLRAYDLTEPAPPIDQRPTTVGVADSDLLGLPGDGVEKSLGLMRSLGVTTVRLLVPWAAIEHTPDAYDWSMVDKTVEAAYSQGFSVLATLNSPPQWAVAPGQPALAGRPASPAAFGRFAGRVAEHFRGKVSAYEIWNEPNGVAFYAPAPDPAGYTALLKAAYPEIKAVDPTAVVVTGGLGAVVDYGGVAMDPVKFVTGMYAAGAKEFFDALAYHPYQYTMKFSESWHPDAPLNQLAGIRQVMLLNGDVDKRVWATEYGEPSSVVGEAGQAGFLDDMLNKWRNLPYAGPVYVYTARDRNSRSTAAEDTLGIYRSDGTAKPAEGIVSSHVRPHGLPIEKASSAPR
ncbi:cellulase family glycosylhydrolase [Mycobacterium antarcticum]|uniref:cellulase family glycosylhydrolase n=1 Tax=Mycolicibacterium sp. TUM20984 TaxID=3023368 RepID=UPI0024E04C69|nr:cellulase family glycosylhydrolase [Mycolicibacterium sp. TUM20984]